MTYLARIAAEIHRLRSPPPLICDVTSPSHSPPKANEKYTMRFGFQYTVTGAQSNRSTGCYIKVWDSAVQVYSGRLSYSSLLIGIGEPTCKHFLASG